MIDSALVIGRYACRGVDMLGSSFGRLMRRIGALPGETASRGGHGQPSGIGARERSSRQARCTALLVQADGAAEIDLTRASPRISVIMPVYNALRHDESHLLTALESIAGQSLPAYELIVVDDGSTDATAEVVRSFGRQHPELRMSILRKENGGQSSARNLGARHAAGEWLAFLDQDDEWRPDRLELVAPLLTSDVDLIYTDADTIDEAGVTLVENIHHEHHLCGEHPRTGLDAVLVRDAYVMPGVMTIRSGFYERLGGFDEQLSGYEDDDLFARAFVAGRLRYTPVSTLKWRIYEGSYSWTPRMTESRLRYWRKLLATFGRDNRQRSQNITLRFFRDFVIHSYSDRLTGNSLADVNLRRAEELAHYLHPVDGAAFGLTRWAWTRTSRPARFACFWFIRGSDRLG